MIDSGYRYDTDAISNTTGSGNDWNNKSSTGGSWNFASNNYVKITLAVLIPLHGKSIRFP